MLHKIGEFGLVIFDKYIKSWKWKKNNTVMLKFKRITKEDFPIIDKYFSINEFAEESPRFCDYAPGTVKMWHEEYSLSYAIFGDCMYLRANYEEEEGTSYLMPVGRTDKDSLIPLCEYLNDKEEATLSVMPEGMKEQIAKCFDIDIERIFADRDWADYIYLREEFCNPSGRKHHNYKYNLNKFAKEHPDFAVEPLCDENKREALEFFERYCMDNPETSSVDDGEFRATVPVILDPKFYSMSGAVLRAEGRIIGITLGEIYKDTVIVHTEKALKEVAGAYQTLALGYQKMMPDSVKYINREEDMGLMGLRRSKLSYSPLRLDYKYTLKLK